MFLGTGRSPVAMALVVALPAAEAVAAVVSLALLPVAASSVTRTVMTAF